VNFQADCSHGARRIQARGFVKTIKRREALEVAYSVGYRQVPKTFSAKIAGLAKPVIGSLGCAPFVFSILAGSEERRAGWRLA
jgi:hypothetical protein